jgi:hypothetical protein
MRTLAHALCVSEPTDLVLAAAGLYSAATNGERFPLVIQGQEVRGSFELLAVVQGTGPIDGDASAAFLIRALAGGANRLTGFTIEGEQGASVGVYVDGADAQALSVIESNRVAAHQTGILLTGPAAAMLSLNVVEDNEVNVDVRSTGAAVVNLNVIRDGATGVRVGDGADVMLRANQVTGHSAQNVETDSPQTDLGTADSAGGNMIQGAGGVNIWNRTRAVIAALGNTLDARSNDQGNTDETDGAFNIANEQAPEGCVEIEAGACP